MNPRTEQSYKERMLQVLVHIQNHLDEALRLEDLAAVAHFSPYHFHRIFQGMMGETVMAHIRRLRLERAAMRLKTGEQAVTQIAFEAGYETHEAFTRAFRGMFGESPSGFRAAHQVQPWPAVPSGVHYEPTGGVQDFSLAQGAAEMDASIRKIDEMRVAFVRHVGPYHEVGPTWGRLMAWAGPRGLCGPDMQCFGICYDDPQVTPPDKIRYDACIVVRDDVTPEGDVGVQTVGGREYATTIHAGPYDNLHQTYAALCGQWIPTQGREMASQPTLEFYRNDPNHTPPAELRTEVCVPLA